MIRIAIADNPAANATTQRPPLRYYLVAFAAMPDGHVCVVDDSDLPGDRMVVPLPSGLMRVVEEPGYGEEDKAEATALAEPVPSAAAFAAAIEHRLGGA